MFNFNYNNKNSTERRQQLDESLELNEKESTSSDARLWTELYFCDLSLSPISFFFSLFRALVKRPSCLLFFITSHISHIGNGLNSRIFASFLHILNNCCFLSPSLSLHFSSTLKLSQSFFNSSSFECILGLNLSH